MIDPIVNLLIWLSGYLGNLGWAILAFTLFTRLILYPINRSALKSSVKMREVQPDLEKIQKKFKDKPQELQKAQLELYKKAGVNPLGGCLPQIFQLVVVIILYQALISLLGNEVVSNGTIATQFFGLDLRHPDPYYVLPVLAAGSQFLASWLMMGKHADKKSLQKEKSVSKSGKKEEKSGIFGSSQMMQQQMMYVMPIITGVIAAKFPAGISLYWVASTFFSVYQQWAVMNKTQRQGALTSAMFWQPK